MSSKLLCLCVTSVVVATSAIALPSKSLAGDWSGGDTPPANEEVTPDASDNSNVNSEDSEEKNITTRHGRSNRIQKSRNRTNRPPSADSSNNASNGNDFARRLWGF
jgi:hypothetical protein